MPNNDIQIDEEPQKGLWQTFKEGFIITDARAIGNNLIKNKIIPSLKDALWDLIGGTIKGIIYHSPEDVRRARERKSYLGEEDGPYVDYRSMSSRASDKYMVQNPIPSSRIARLMFSDREMAKDIYAQMIARINSSGKVTVYEYYSMCYNDDPERLKKLNDFAKTSYGWVNLAVVPDIVQVRRDDGQKYYLNLPEPIDLRDIR